MYRRHFINGIHTAAYGFLYVKHPDPGYLALFTASLAHWMNELFDDNHFGH